MAHQWQPNPASLQSLAEFTAVASNRPDLNAQIQQQLEEFNKVPDFDCYLLFIFKHLNGSTSQRLQAGILLKNNIMDHWASRIPPVRQYIQTEVVSVLGDPDERVRATCGSIVATILRKVGIQSWPEGVLQFGELLNSPDAAVVDGSLSALLMIFQDHQEALAKDEFAQILQALLQKLFAFLSHQTPKFRNVALDCFSTLLEVPPKILAQNATSLLEAVIRIAEEDSSEKAQKRVCIIFRDMITARLEQAMMNRFPQILDYVMRKTLDPSPLVSLHACEFWNRLADTELCHDALKPHLDRLVPILLTAMKMSPDELDVAGANDPQENAHEQDTDQDIRPYTNKGRRSKRAESDDDDLEWTLRKCAAASLDGISFSFDQGEVMAVMLPHVQKMLNSSDWLEREAAVLALGAISLGSAESMQRVLPELIPYLVQLTRDPTMFLIRSISCWTLGRYSSFIVEYEDEDYFQPVLLALLERMLDRNKRVQEYACANVGILCDKGGSQAAPHLDKIIPTVVQAYQMYQTRSSFVLHETIGSICYAVTQELDQPQFMNILMPCLIQRWNTIGDQDIHLIPLLEALSAVSSAIGHSFVPFTPPIIERCVRLIQSFLVEYAAYAQNSTKMDEPDERFAVSALDLISSAGEAIGASIDELLVRYNFVNMLFQACACKHAEIMQAAFGTAGVVAKYCPAHILPIVRDLVPLLLDQMVSRVKYVRLPNNAAWAIGEIILLMRKDIEPVANTIASKLINLIEVEQHRDTINLLQNTAVTLGRLAYFCPQSLVSYFPKIALRWCYLLAHYESDNEEKDSAFRGLLVLIKHNPAALLGEDGEFKWFCHAIASWHICPDELAQQFHDVLHLYKQQLGPVNWAAYTRDLSEQTKAILQSLYKI